MDPNVASDQPPPTKLVIMALYHGVSLKVLENISSDVVDGSVITPVSKKHKPPNERPTVCTL